MISLKRTTSDNKDFEKLVVQLDAYLRVLDGDDHAFYAQFNKSSLLKNALICYENEIAIGIGAYKEYDSETVEIKRMFTLPEYRGKGVAKTILSELENWAKEEKYQKCILETSFKLVNAIELYKKFGFEITERYGQYANVESSICMKKAFKLYLKTNIYHEVGTTFITKTSRRQRQTPANRTRRHAIRL